MNLITVTSFSSIISLPMVYTVPEAVSPFVSSVTFSSASVLVRVIPFICFSVKTLSAITLSSAPASSSLSPVTTPFLLIVAVLVFSASAIVIAWLSPSKTK